MGHGSNLEKKNVDDCADNLLLLTKTLVTVNPCEFHLFVIPASFLVIPAVILEPWSVAIGR